MMAFLDSVDHRHTGISFFENALEHRLHFLCLDSSYCENPPSCLTSAHRCPTNVYFMLFNLKMEVTEGLRVGLAINSRCRSRGCELCFTERFLDSSSNEVINAMNKPTSTVLTPTVAMLFTA